MAKQQRAGRKTAPSTEERSDVPSTGGFRYKRRQHLQIDSTLASSDQTFLIGPSGTGKTLEAILWAVQRLQRGDADLIILSRPMVECGGERMGFLPGDEREKLNPWLVSYLDVLGAIYGRGPAVKMLAKFEAWPLATIRGRTIGDRMISILDESQNCSVAQLQAYLTRIGIGGKQVVCGDYDQGDLAGGGGHLNTIATRLEKKGLAGVVRFTDADILRHPNIAGINEVFKEIRGGK